MFRIQPAGPAHAYRTFQVKVPRGPEFQRPATCEQVDCEHWLHGWQTLVDATNTDLLEALRASGRPYTEIVDDGQPFALIRVFTFAPGTPCFRASQHRVAVRPDVPQLFVVRGGDWRGNPTGEWRIHQRPDDWVEDLQESTEALRETIERG